uniref:NADH dehydrogenase subunit 6 n=1 Tax=Paurocephala sauteri TaxID=2768670 RepID=A0A7L9R570_9HEMI|nr:NADH dehydrogenase subunit 6 [Paurocephala sauteri]QOL10537.1 NADH dehydrogenase subunit 6 [Paurocephala sauteri]
MLNLKHPLLFSMFILCQTILTCIYTRFLMKSSWLSMTIFMMMVGGLMILFIYITSLSKNMKFTKINFTKMMPYFIISIFLSSFYPQFNYSNENMQLMDIFNMEMYKIFCPMNIKSSIFMFLYLLFMLIIMINLLKYEKGPLRKKY